MTNPPIDWLQVARLLLLSRELDRLEVEQLTPQGKVKYQFSAMGHELAQILLALHLTHPHDAASVYYRSRPFLLASGLTAREALAAGMARTGSPSEGRDVGVTHSLPRRSGRHLPAHVGRRGGAVHARRWLGAGHRLPLRGCWATRTGGGPSPWPRAARAASRPTASGRR